MSVLYVPLCRKRKKLEQLVVLLSRMMFGVNFVVACSAAVL